MSLACTPRSASVLLTICSVTVQLVQQLAVLPDLPHG